jgi:biopolymer transport protein ExbB
VWEIIQAAGWPIWPLIIASIIALAIIGERFWALRRDVVAPANLLPEVQKWLGQGGITKETLNKLDNARQGVCQRISQQQKFARSNQRGD